MGTSIFIILAICKLSGAAEGLSWGWIFATLLIDVIIAALMTATDKRVRDPNVIRINPNVDAQEILKEIEEKDRRKEQEASQRVSLPGILREPTKNERTKPQQRQ